MKRLLTILLCTLLLAFPTICLAVSSVEIMDTDLNTLKNTIIGDMFDMGYMVHSSNEFQIIFKRELTDFSSSLFLGSQFNRTPEIRASFNMLQSDKTVRIMLDVRYVTNPGSGFEQYTPNNYIFWSYYLEELKARYNGGAYFGFDINFNKTDGGYKVIRLLKNSSAEEAGLKKGDLIIAVDGKKVNADKLTKLIISAAEGTIVTLTVKNAAGERKIEVTKKYVPGITQKLSVTSTPSPSPTDQEQLPTASPAPPLTPATATTPDPTPAQ